MENNENLAPRHEGVPEELRALGLEVVVIDDATLEVKGLNKLKPADAFKAGVAAEGIYDGFSQDPKYGEDGDSVILKFD